MISTYDSICLQDKQIVLSHLQNIVAILRNSNKYATYIKYTNTSEFKNNDSIFSAINKLKGQLYNTLYHEFKRSSLDNLSQASPTCANLSASEILKPFLLAITGDSASERVVEMSLSALIDFLDMNCKFIVPSSLVEIIEASVKCVFDINEFQSQEVVLSKIMRLNVACTHHQYGITLDRKYVFLMLNMCYDIRSDSLYSELMRSIAAQSMSALITYFFEHTLNACRAEEDKTDGILLELRCSSTEMNKKIEDSNVPWIVQYIFNMIVGGRVRRRQLQNDINSDFLRFRPQLIDANDSAYSSFIQSDGIILAKNILFSLKEQVQHYSYCDRIIKFTCSRLCSALYIAGVATKNSIIHSQIVSTIHIILESFSYCVPQQSYQVISKLYFPQLRRLVCSQVTDLLSDGSYSPLSKEQASTPLSESGTISPAGGKANQHDINSEEKWRIKKYLTSHNFESDGFSENAIQSLTELCCIPAFPAFCFSHFNLNASFSPLFDELCQLLGRLIFDGTVGASGVAGDVELLINYTKEPNFPALFINSSCDFFELNPNYQYSHPSSLPCRSLECPFRLSEMHWEQITLLSIECIALIIQNLRTRVSDCALEMQRKKTNGDSDPVKDVYKRVTQQRIFSGLFNNRRFKEAISFIKNLGKPFFCLKENFSGWEFGEFLYEQRSCLDRSVLGDFLGDLGAEPAKPKEDSEEFIRWKEERQTDDHKPFTCRFFAECIRGFLNCFVFRNKSLLDSIREMVFQVNLPKEAQKIDRFMECFSTQWYNSNRNSPENINPFKSFDGAFILSFSIIMLNTDLHSTKMSSKMKPEEFIRNNRGIDAGSSLPDEFLLNIYNDICENEIIMIDMADKYGIVLSEEVICKNCADPHSAIPEISLNTTDVTLLRSLDHYIYESLWRPAVTAFIAVMATITQSCNNSPHSILGRENKVLKSILSSLKIHSRDNYHVLCMVIQGFKDLIEVGHSLGVYEIIDYSLVMLGSYVVPDLWQWCKSNSTEGANIVGQNVSTLLFLDLIFTIVTRYGNTAVQGWIPISEIVHLLLLTGALKKENSKGNVMHMVNKHDEKIECSSSSSRNSGWFSFFRIGEDEEAVSGRKKGYPDSTISFERVKSVVPDYDALQEIYLQLKQASFRRAMQSICRVAVFSTDEDDSQLLSDAFSSGMTASFIVELAGRHTTLPDVKVIHDVVIPYLHDLVKKSQVSSSKFSVSTKNSDSGSKQAFWDVLTNRLVKSEVSVLNFGLKNLTIFPVSSAVVLFKDIINNGAVSLDVQELVHLCLTQLSGLNSADATMSGEDLNMLLLTLVDIIRTLNASSTSRDHIFFVQQLMSICQKIHTQCGVWKNEGALKNIAETTKLLSHVVLAFAEIFSEIISTQSEVSGNNSTENQNYSEKPFEVPTKCIEMIFWVHGMLTSEIYTKSCTNQDASEYNYSWFEDWLTCVSSLGMAVLLAEPAISREIYLLLQRCIFDISTKKLTPPQGSSLFFHFLFPLATRVCDVEERESEEKPSFDVQHPNNALASFSSSGSCAFLPQLLVGKKIYARSEEEQCLAITVIVKSFMNLHNCIKQNEKLHKLVWLKLLSLLCDIYSACGASESETAVQEAVHQSLKNAISVLKTLTPSEGNLSSEFWRVTQETLKKHRIEGKVL